MTKEHVFGCRPASRLEQVDDEHSERTQEAIFEQNHRMIANDVCKPMEGQILQKSPAEAGLKRTLRSWEIISPHKSYFARAVVLINTPPPRAVGNGFMHQPKRCRSPL